MQALLTAREIRVLFHLLTNLPIKLLNFLHKLWAEGTRHLEFYDSRKLKFWSYSLLYNFRLIVTYTKLS